MKHWKLSENDTTTHKILIKSKLTGIGAAEADDEGGADVAAADEALADGEDESRWAAWNNSKKKITYILHSYTLAIKSRHLGACLCYDCLKI